MEVVLAFLALTVTSNSSQCYLGSRTIECGTIAARVKTTNINLHDCGQNEDHYGKYLEQNENVAFIKKKL